MNRQTILLIAVGIISPVSYTSAQEPPARNPATQEAEAVQLSQDSGINLEGAKKILSLQPKISGLANELNDKFADSYGGIYVTYQPVLKININATTGAALKEIEALISRGYNELLPFANIKVVGNSVNALQRRLDELAKRRAQAGYGGAYIDIPNNQIVLLTGSRETGAESIIASLPKGIQVRIDKQQHKEILLASIGGGGRLTCTSGFSVRNSSGTRGITTAGHCANTQAYNGTNLPFIAERYGQEWDVQWHTTPGYIPTNRFYNGSSYSTMTSFTGRFGQYVGQYVCKYGYADGKRCGYIRSTSYASAIPNASATL